MAVTETTLKARYFSAEGEAEREIELPEDPFDGVVHESSVYTAVTAYLANQRQGTASAKNRSAVRGGGRKPWRQKGTGRARHGTIRSPIWRGGGVTFPPSARSYRQDVPRKVKQLARRSALNALAAEDRVLVIEGFEFDAPKTRRMRELLERLGTGAEKVLILTGEHRPEVFLSARNLPDVEVRAWGTESVYDIVVAEYVVVEAPALQDAGSAGRSSTGAREPAEPPAANGGEAEDA